MTSEPAEPAANAVGDELGGGLVHSGAGAVVPLDLRFERLYHDRFQPIYAYALRRAAPSDVPDLVAEVFTVAWRRLDRVPGRPDDLLWLYGVARRVVSQHHRARRRAERLRDRLAQDGALCGIPPPPGDAPFTPQVAALLDRLRPRDRELVRLLVWEELSHSEAATVLGCSVNAVAIRWHRSMRRLRRDLDGQGRGNASSGTIPYPSGRDS